MIIRTLRYLLVVLFAISVGAGTAFAATPATYEAWYDTVMTVPGQPVQKGKLHTYFDGKQQYSLQTDEHGNSSGTKFEIPFDSTLVDYMKLASAKSLGKKDIDGKSCEGWSYADQMMKRPTINWIDDSGHLYYQEQEKFTGTNGKWEQRRTKLLENPKGSDLTTDKNCNS